MLSPTPDEALLDAHGRPYFLWDCEMTMTELKARLADPDPEISAYFIGKVLRQAKPDDALRLIPLSSIESRWSETEQYLGDKREFWAWLLSEWKMRRAAH